MKQLKRILKIVGISAGVFISLVILLALFTQTQFFKDRLRVIIASSISTNINGTLHLGTIEGNFLSGFSIDSLAIFDDKGILITTGKITCQYDIVPVFEKRLKMKYLIIEQPKIRFVRSMDGKWNLSNIIKPSADTAAGRLDWILQFDDVELKNASIVLMDSTSLFAHDHWDMPASYFEYHNFSVNDLNIKLNAIIREKNISARINHLSCYSPQSQFELTHFKGDFTLSDKEITARNTIIQTGKSYLEFDASISKINIFKGIELEDLEHDSTRLQFRAKNIDLSELKSFIPQINFLDGSAYVNLTATGEFGNLTINHLNLKTFRNTLNLSGNISNLHKPDQLYLDVIIGDSKIVPADVPKLLPGLPLPPFKEEEALEFATTFIGKPINFRTRTTLRGIKSEAEITGMLNLESSPPSYDFSFLTSKLNLSNYFDLGEIKTIISTNGTITGSGFSFNDLSTKLDMSIDSSDIQNIHLNNSRITTNSSHNIIDAVVSLNSDRMKALFNGQAEVSETSLKAMSGNIEFTSLDLSSLFDDSLYKSDLNLQGTFSGSGQSLSNLDAELDLSLFPSSFRGHTLNSGNILLSLDQRDSNAKSLTIQSPISDVSIEGIFDLSSTIKTLIHQTDNLIRVTEQHATPESSLTAGISPVRILRKKDLPQQKIDLNYKLKIKDLDPVASVLDGTPFNAQAEITGQLKGTENKLSFSCDGTIDEFFIGTSRGGALFKSGSLSLRLDSLSDTETLEHLIGNVKLSIDSGLLNTRTLHSIALELDYKKMNSKVRGHYLLDSLYNISATGNISVQPHTYAFDFDSLNVTCADRTWLNDQDVQFRLNTEGLRLMRGLLRRSDESVSLTGAIYSGGTFDLSAAVRNFELGSLGIFLRNPQLTSRQHGLSGKANFDLHLTGTPADLSISFRSDINNLYFRQTRIGQVTTSIDYNKQNASINLIAKQNYTDTVPSFAINGTLPIDLAFSNVTERFPDNEQHLEIKSDRFNLNILDPLLPDFDNLSGILRCDVVIGGTPRVPAYRGAISLSDTRFLFVPNNISYVVNGELEPKGEQIVFKSFLIKNTSENKINGEATFTGSLSTQNFKISSFDVIARGQLLLMTDATRNVNPNMYGLLLTETSLEGLKLQGTLERPYISGTLYINEANLTFPPTKKTETANSDLTLRYVVIDDTTKQEKAGQKISKFYSEIDSAEASAEKNGEIREYSLIDRLRYNLSIETRGLTALTMVFTPTTGEELYAELDGKINAINDQGIPNLYGVIEISPRSYYNFFKRFDATGKLKFVGNWNNPELDINATYEGYRQITQTTTTENAPIEQTNLSAAQLSTEQKVIVELKIGGTRFEPKLTMSMKVQSRTDENPVDWASEAKGGDVQSDAISFIITGKFRDQLTSKEQQDFTNLGSATGTSVASSLLSSIFSDVLKREFPSIRRVEVSYQGGNFQAGTSLNVSATAFKGHLRVGGRIFNDLGNTNVSYQLSLGEFLNSVKIRNLYLEILRKVEGDNPDDKKLTNEARIFYKFSF
jgi:hypothetical protein